MSKVGEYFRQMKDSNVESTEELTNQIEEPTDDEVAEIESKLNQTSFEDINWDQLLQTVTFYFKKSLVYILKNPYITM